MKIIRRDIRYTLVEKDVLAPFGAWGWLWRIFLAVLLSLLFILLFCWPECRVITEENIVSESSPTPVPHSGDVQILLRWDNENDLDLSCEDPNKELINYANKESSSHGCLDVDMNVQPPFSTAPIENIYWPEGKAPSGKYTVYLTLYAVHSDKSFSDYKVIVKYGDKTEEIEGVATEVGHPVEVFSFELE